MIWLFRWLIFRIMLGAGLIKLRGDSCWRDLTCLYYHYETQPIPNPLSSLLHFMPQWFHQLGTLWNHFKSWLPRGSPSGLAGCDMLQDSSLVSFQVILILSGNLSFLNWVTIIPALACFDDSWSRSYSAREFDRANLQASAEAKISRGQRVVVPGLVLLVAVLSFSRSQICYQAGKP